MVSVVGSINVARIGARVLEDALVVVLDGHGKIEHANARFEQLLGRAFEDLVQADFFDVAVAAHHRSQARACFVAGEGCSCTLVTATGAEIVVAWMAEVIEQGDHARAILAIGQPYPTRVIQTAEVTARAIAAFDSAPDAMLIVDEGGYVIQASKQAELTFGYTHDELFAIRVEDLVPPEDRPNHAELRARFFARAASREMGSGRSRLWALRKDGTKIPVEISLSPIRGVGRRYVVAAVRDVSARVRMEEEHARLEDQLRDAQRLEAIGTFAAGVAHDFNNLVTTILMNIELMREHNERREELEEIVSAAMRGRDLVRKLLTFGRAEPPRMEVSSLVQVIEEVVTAFARTSPREITIKTEIEDAPAVSIDAGQIHRALVNLCANALHAIEPNRGTITVRLDGVELGPGDATGLAAGPYARVQVKDDGRGIDPSVLPRVFEPFFTTKRAGKGSGLGLSVVHGVVAEHSGGVTVHSVLGKGTVFTVYVPAAATRTRGRVLLIDDERSIVRASSRILRQLGWEVEGFESARAALEHLRLDPSRFDVIITDQSMPELQGLDVARAVASMRADLPVLLTTSSSIHTAEELAGANVAHRLPKPYAATDLKNALAKVAGYASARTSGRSA